MARPREEEVGVGLAVAVEEVALVGAAVAGTVEAVGRTGVEVR